MEAFAHADLKSTEALLRPEGIGSAVALGLLEALETYDHPPLDHPSNAHFAGAFYTLPTLADILNVRRKHTR
jgi:hypothetical protein